MKLTTKMIYYNRFKYRSNNVVFKNNKIYVKHSSKVINANKISFQELIWETSYANEYINKLLSLENGYCPKYLKSIIKKLKNKVLEEDDNKTFIHLEEELYNNYEKYLSLYYDKEIFELVFKFGKKVWNLISKYSETFLLLLQNLEFENSIKELVNLLTKLDKRRLNMYIDDLVQNIGVPVNINRDKSDWTNFIYSSVLCYLMVILFSKEFFSKAKKYEEDDFHNHIPMTKGFRRKSLSQQICHIDKIQQNALYNCIYNILRNINKGSNFSEGYEIIKLPKDTKQVQKIKRLMPFIVNYLDKYCTSYIQNCEFHYADHMIDVLEDHRQYLIIDAINKKQLEKIEKIKKYSYDELNSSYRRKLLKY